MQQLKDATATTEHVDNKMELKRFFDSLESSGVLTESDKKIIFDIIKLMVNSFKDLFEPLRECAGLDLNESKYARYLFFNENINQEFDRKDFNDIYPSTDIFFPQALFRYSLENFMRRMGSNVKNRSVQNSFSIKNSIFRIIHRLALSLNNENNHPYKSYFTEDTISDGKVSKDISFFIKQRNADLVDKLYDKLIEYDKNHDILTDLFDKKEIYKGYVMGERCLELKRKELKQRKRDSDKKAEIEAGFRPDENPCDENKELNYLKEINQRKCFENMTGLHYLSEGYCDYFNEMYRAHIEKLPPIKNDTKIDTDQPRDKDVDARSKQEEGLNVICNDQEAVRNDVNFYEDNQNPEVFEQKLHRNSIKLHNVPINSETIENQVMFYDKNNTKIISDYSATTNSIFIKLLLIFSGGILFYFIYVVFKRGRTLNK